MAVNVKLKRSAVPNKAPTVENLDFGELAINTYDGKLFFKVNNQNGESVVTLSQETSGVTEDNLQVDSSNLDNSNSAVLSGVLADLDQAISNIQVGGFSGVFTDSSLSGNGLENNELKVNYPTINIIERSGSFKAIKLMPYLSVLLRYDDMYREPIATLFDRNNNPINVLVGS